MTYLISYKSIYNLYFMPPQPLCIIGPLSQVWALLLFGCKFSACNQMHICMQQYTHPLPAPTLHLPTPTTLCLLYNFLQDLRKTCENGKVSTGSRKVCSAADKRENPKGEKRAKSDSDSRSIVRCPHTHTQRNTHTI